MLIEPAPLGDSLKPVPLGETVYQVAANVSRFPATCTLTNTDVTSVDANITYFFCLVDLSRGGQFFGPVPRPPGRLGIVSNADLYDEFCTDVKEKYANNQNAYYELIAPTVHQQKCFLSLANADIISDSAAKAVLWSAWLEDESGEHMFKAWQRALVVAEESGPKKRDPISGKKRPIRNRDFIRELLGNQRELRFLDHPVEWWKGSFPNLPTVEVSPGVRKPLSVAPRILGRADRGPDSKTFPEWGQGPVPRFLFHFTSKETLREILQSKKLLHSSLPSAGSGVYFTSRAPHTISVPGLAEAEDLALGIDPDKRTHCLMFDVSRMSRDIIWEKFFKNRLDSTRFVSPEHLVWNHNEVATGGATLDFPFFIGRGADLDEETNKPNYYEVWDEDLVDGGKTRAVLVAYGPVNKFLSSWTVLQE